MKELIIVFPERFTQINQDYYYENFFIESQNSDITKIIFDLERLEWISSEQVTFLFAWLRKIITINKNTTVKLPYSYSKFSGDNDDTLKRRKLIKFYLWEVWKLYNIGLKQQNFENTDDINALYKIYENSSVGKRVLPFQRINVQKNYNILEIDTQFKKLTNKNGQSIFSIEQRIEKMLEENDCFSPFENRIISDIITKELVMNSIEHSKAVECYFTATLINKWKINNPKTSENFINQFLEEKPFDILNFYRDKDECKKIIELKLKTKNYDIVERIADLKKGKEFNVFKNQSFVELTFIDFGDGINNTLKKEFFNDFKLRKEELLKNLSENFSNLDIDNKILEYAFLLESSKNPFDRKIQYYQLIPRGLYFLIDMVRRYKGMLVARSGKAKIIYDFSNEILINGKSKKVSLVRKYTAKEAIKHTTNEYSFNGTMITIVLPEKKNKELKKSGIRIDNKYLNNYIFNRENSDFFPKEVFNPKEFHHLSLVFVFNVSQTKKNFERYNDKKGILNIIFEKINEKLLELKGKNCVLFIDFDNIPDDSQTKKILLYLSNTPLVNEFTKIIVLNLSENEYTTLKDYEIDVFADSPEYIFKPIPCLNINYINKSCSIENIKWIGVRNKEDEIALTRLFFGNNDSVAISSIEDKWLAEGHIFSIFQDRVYSIFTDFNELVEKAIYFKTNEIQIWCDNQSKELEYKLIDKIKNEKTSKGKSDVLFLTSKGAYQKDYLSLYEQLNFKYAARYFAELLLNKYILNAIEIYEETNEIRFNELAIDKQNEVKSTFKFNKLLAITVSSQLIAVEIRNLIREKTKYEFLLDDDITKTPINRCPDLVKLSSYLSFEDEAPFKELAKGDFRNILIVNDVISTASLIQRIKKACENKNVDATIKGVLTIADTRLRNIDENKEYKSVFFDDLNLNEISFERKIVSLMSTEKQGGIEYRKYKLKAIDNLAKYKIKRINPILNSVITLKNEHTEKEKVLYDEPENFFNEVYKGNKIFADEIFKIGHFKQNLSCNSYYTGMHELFEGENGFNLLNVIKNKIENEPRKLGFVDEYELKLNLNFAAHNIENLIKKNKIYESIENLKTIVQEIKTISNSALIHQNVINYEPDFIFHPVHSGIEEVTEDVFHSVFKTNKTNIISLQRYYTKNGWRFPFPAKMLNAATKGRHVLIIDSGALSGQSLVQLIDSISFLEVGRIDVVTIIGRIDDFQREFYSRLKSIKVKKLKEDLKSISYELQDNNEVVVVLNILFGVNLHIPSYHSEEVCIYCKELRDLENFNDERLNLPKHTRDYIDQRRIEIKQCNSIDDINADYLPKIRDSKQPDLRNIFLIRDKLGKVDSYRFYEEYFEFFDEEIGDKITNYNDLFYDQNISVKIHIELILTCILHEPNLLGVLRDLMNNIYEICSELLKNIFALTTNVNNLYYEWSDYSLLRLYKIFLKQEFYEPDNLRLAYKKIRSDKIALNYLSFLLYEPYVFGSDKVVKNNLNNYFLECYANNFKEFDDNNIEPLSNVITHLLTKIKPIDNNSSIASTLIRFNSFFHNKYTKSHNENLKNDITYMIILITNADFNKIEDLESNVKKVINSIKSSLIPGLNKLTSKSVINDYYPFLMELKNLIEEIDGFHINNQENRKTPKLYYEEYNIIFLDYIDKLQKSYFSENQQFYNFSNTLYTNLKNIIKQIVTKDPEYCRFKLEKPNYVLDYSSIPDSLQVFCPEKILYNVYRELLINSIKREQNNDATLEITLMNYDENGLTIKLHQNKKFLEPTEKEKEAKQLFGGREIIINSLFNVESGFGFVKDVTPKDQKEDFFEQIIVHNLIDIKI